MFQALVLTSCGGASTGTSGTPGGNPPVVNYTTIVVDAGPPAVNAVNTPYISVTLCAPGSTTACQTIDHVLVDTGSSGFRVLAAALGNGLTPAQMSTRTDASGNAVVECTQFVDGYTWGPVKGADLKVAGETAANLTIQVIGDPQYPAALAPANCVSVPNGEEDTVLKFGANGVLGIGNYLQDCGPFCATGVQDGSAYSACSPVPVSCHPVAVALAEQVTNPVAMFASDNNGVLVQLPQVSASGTTTVTGTLIFGIGTQTNNALHSATIFALNAAYGTFITNFAGSQLNNSFLDTGTNGNFFPDSSIAVCQDQPDFFCPSSDLSLSGEIQGTNGTLAQVKFEVSNADTMPAIDDVEPALAGPATASTMSTFVWGLPFFLGRNVYIGFENATIGGVQGPVVAF